MPARLLAAVVLLATVLATASCGLAGTRRSDPNRPLTVVADSEPHATLLREVERRGLLGDVRLDVTEISGAVDPNQLVESGDVDANYFQHVPYLTDWNTERHGDLRMVGAVHVEPLGLYSRTVRDLAATPDGARIAIPADPVNEARAMFLLADAGLLRLDVTPDTPGLDYAAVGEKDITANPHHLRFVRIDRPQLFATLDDPQIDLSIVNGNYALEGGLRPDRDALVLDRVAGSPFANGIVTRPDMAQDRRVRTLVAALESPEIARFIRTTYSGAVVPAKD